jgi:hypothetical protein
VPCVAGAENPWKPCGPWSAWISEPHKSDSLSLYHMVRLAIHQQQENSS